MTSMNPLFLPDPVGTVAMSLTHTHSLSRSLCLHGHYFLCARRLTMVEGVEQAIVLSALSCSFLEGKNCLRRPRVVNASRSRHYIYVASVCLTARLVRCGLRCAASSQRRKMSALSSRLEVAVDQSFTPRFLSTATQRFVNSTVLTRHTSLVERGTCRQYGQATRTRKQRHAVEPAASPVRTPRSHLA